jgi:putative phosphoribosyl transferase
LNAERLGSSIVLGLPRGGIPVAAQVATSLGAPLDVFVARKIGAPGHSELGIGAVAEGLDEAVISDVARELRVAAHDLEILIDLAAAELEREVALYRGGRPLSSLVGRTVVVVDDGLATGVTAEAALKGLRNLGAGRLVLAVPVSPRGTVTRLVGLADEVVFVDAPPDFVAVGHWYLEFGQTTDDEVIDLLTQYAERGSERAGEES